MIVMGKKHNRRTKHALVYPQHVFKPKEFLRFIELRSFSEGWDDLGLNDEDLSALQILIMLNPLGPPVVRGSGGLRKIRFAPARWRTGKSGAARIGYAYFKEYGAALLIIAYAKGEKEDLTADERKTIRRLIERVKGEFASGVI